MPRLAVRLIQEIEWTVDAVQYDYDTYTLIRLLNVT